MKIKDIMNKRVIKLNPNQTIFSAAKIFIKNHISGAPVVSKNKIVGILSETDIIKFMQTKFPKEFEMHHEPHILSLMLFKFIKEFFHFNQEIKRIRRIKVKDVMSKDVISISPNASIFEAANLMIKHKINRLPVLKKGKIVGIVTRADLIKSLSK